jgi:hypothetical protein
MAASAKQPAVVSAWTGTPVPRVLDRVLGNPRSRERRLHRQRARPWGLVAYGASEKEAVAHVAERASEYVRALVESGKPVPHARQPSEMPSDVQLKIGRAMISVKVG